jgi:Flp pilus assembly protein TadG
MPLVGLSLHSPPPAPRSGRNRFSSRRGNTIVEFSLCFLPLIAIFLGIADISFAVFLRAMLESAVRDGANYASTYNATLSGSTCNSMSTCIRDLVRRNSLGFLSTDATAGLTTVRYYAPNNLTTPITSANCDPSGAILLPFVNGSTASELQRPLRYVNQPGNIVEVRVTDFPWNWMAPIPGFWSSTQIRMSASASVVLPSLPNGGSVPPAP